MYIKDTLKASISGNAATATKLATSRSITIGNKANNFDGSGNISFTLADIGAATSDHKHGLLHQSLGVEIANTTEDSGWTMFNSSYTGYMLKSVRFGASSPSWGVGNYGAGIIFGGADTKGVISCAYGSPSIKIAGGNGSKPVWWMGLSGTSGTTYNLANFSTDGHTHSYLPLAGGTMTGPISSSSMATTWVNAAKGNAIINSTLTPGSFSPIASAGTTNGRMTLAWYNAELNVAYLTKANCDSSTNTVAHLGTLMNESGGAYWPGTIGASRSELTGVGPQLTLKATQSNNYATIQFINSSSASMGYIGMSAVNGGLYRWKADASQARAIIDEDTWSWALPSPTSGAYWQGIMKVNGDGVMEAGKYLDFHNTGNTSNDYDVRLQSNGAYKNTVYLPTGSGDLSLMQNTNGYWGIMTPGGNNADWIRTTVNGIIPYQSGGASSLGTDSWPFNNVWTNRINGVNTTNFFHSGNNVINVADRSSGDSGFGNSSRAVGFIGRFPGWDSNCVYINTYSASGGETKSYDHVKIKGSYVYLDGNIYIQGTPVSVQSSAPGCGGVWIQI